MESTTKLIVHSSGGHLPQCEQRHAERRVAHLRVGRGPIVNME